MAKQATQEVLEFPAGGIADFYMEDHEIEALEAEEAEEAFGSAGIATFKPIAHRMASYGRHGDDTVAHVETGELVIPKALIEDNPRLRASIFSHLEELGVEDPERYVVGSGANSINPDTGLPEFFFKKIRKAFSKVVKGVSKAVKSVGKVLKKAAPIILPAIGTFFMGPIYGAALGSGIATLVQGGNLKDAFKSALISGGTGALMSGVTGGFKAMGKPGGGFMKGFGDSVRTAANTSNISTGLSNMGKALTGDFSGLSLGNAAGGPTAEGGTNPIDAAKDAATATGQPNDIREAFAQKGAGPKPAAFTPDMPSPYGPDPMAIDQSSMLTSGVPDSTLNNIQTGSVGGDGLLDTAKGYYNKGMDFLTGGTPADNDIYKLAGEKMAAAKQAGVPLTGDAAIKAATAELTPGILRTYGPSLALAGTAAYAGGMFDTPVQDDPTAEDIQEQLGPTGEQLIALDPSKYLLPEETPQYAQGPTTVGTNYGIDPRTGRPIVNPFRRPSYGLPVLAAEGGEIFPRRVGGIMPDEGVPGKDSVRAMLMPGEFVMTTDAVRGLGNGNNDQGIRNMYDMMRGLEAKGRAMA